MDTMPSTPDPQLVALVLRLLRWALTLLSAFGVTFGATLTNDATLTIIAGGLVGLGTAIWNIVDWIRTARHAHATAVASAAAGAAVQPAGIRAT